MPKLGENKQTTEIRRLKSGLLELLHKVGLVQNDYPELTTEDMLRKVRNCKWYYRDDDYLYKYLRNTPDTRQKLNEIPF